MNGLYIIPFLFIDNIVALATFLFFQLLKFQISLNVTSKNCSIIE
jgi:hypothetical protein